MVCQAASQTRFRALKHENGVAGCATIIVRVIACFQPLQDCQVRIRVLALHIEIPINFCLFVALAFQDASSMCMRVKLICLWNLLQAEYFRHLLKPVT